MVRFGIQSSHEQVNLILLNSLSFDIGSYKNSGGISIRIGAY